jgi:HlyD family type I secretion membrane fusion protein
MTNAEGFDVAPFAQVRAQRDAHRREFTESVAGEKAAHDRASKELKAAQQLLEKLEKTLPSYQRSAAAYEDLVGRQLVSALQAEEKAREALEKAQDLEVQRATVASLEAAVEESVRHLQQVSAAYESGLHSDRIATVVRIGQLEQDLVRAKSQQEHLELRAPQAGIVKELSTTTIGAVVQPGAVLLSLVPADEPLLAEVLIENKDIGFVRSGQAVRLQKYGMLQGVVHTVSADSRSDGWQEGASQRRDELGRSGRSLTFKAVVELQEQHLSIDGGTLPLAAGMQLHAEIVEGRRTVLEYLLSPLRRVAGEAGQSDERRQDEVNRPYQSCKRDQPMGSVSWKRVIWLMCLGAFAMSAAACGIGVDEAQWREEVRLHDGQTIVVSMRATRYANGFPTQRRGAFIDIELGYEPMQVEWKGSAQLQPFSFELFDGVPHLALVIRDKRECGPLKKPDDFAARLMRWEGGQWREVSQDSFPITEALANLHRHYWGYSAKEDARGFITWEYKAIHNSFYEDEPLTVEQYLKGLQQYCGNSAR